MRDERYKFRKGDLVRKQSYLPSPPKPIGIILYHHLGCFEMGTTYVNILWNNGERTEVDIGSYIWDNTEVLSRA